MFKGQQLYTHYWEAPRGSYGEPFVDPLCQFYSFSSVLDAGSGEGTVVRRFLANGKSARGIELSPRALQICQDLVADGIVHHGTLTDLPFEDDSFDLVFSSEVLEHIPESDVPRVVGELCRVAKNHLFLTISLRPSSDNNAYHLTLKSREWWERHFVSNGCSVNREVVSLFQKTLEGATTREVLEAGPTKNIMSELEWFIANPPVDFKGEIEPWFFAFDKTGA
jgi:SAM-dependent methyltransferase